MSKAANAISMPLDEEYLAKFNRIAFEDVPADLLACYFRLDKERITLLGNDPLFVVNSRNAVVRALDNGYEPELIFIRNHEYNRDLAERIGLLHPDAQICFLDDEKRTALKNDPDGKVYSFISFKCAGLFRKKPLKSVPERLHTSKWVVIFRGFEPGSEDFFDIGPQVRSAAAFFADAVLFGSGVDPYDRYLIRATAGNLFYVPFAVYDSDKDLMNLLRGRGFTTVLIAAGDTEGAVPVDEAGCNSTRLAVIVDHGIQTGQKADPVISCDKKVYVPGKAGPGIASCNTSIVLYSLFAGKGLFPDVF
jgi:YHS domain-containing protein